MTTFEKIKVRFKSLLAISHSLFQIKYMNQNNGHIIDRIHQDTEDSTNDLVLQPVWSIVVDFFRG